MWANCWAAVQYICPYGGRDTTVPFHSISSVRSRPHGSVGLRYGNGDGSCTGDGIRAPSTADSGTTQGEIDVANDLLRNGPSGTFSNDWMSRALQSLSSTIPKTWSAKWATPTRWPSALGTPTTKPTSASTSSRSQGP